MITFAPSLSWASILKLMFCKQPTDRELAKPWLKKDDEVVWFSRTAWALHTIARWWEINFLSKPVVWVPGYFCNQSLWPLRQAGVKLVFYPIEDKMQPNWEACKELEKEAEPDIFIATHFYGFITPTQEIESFCKKYDALLVEDAAHIIQPVGDVGEKGHFILYSPHKLFPLSHGAACVVRPAVNEYMKKKSIQKQVSLQQVSFQVGKDNPAISKWFMKKVLQKLIGDKLDFLRKKIPFEEDGTSFPMPYTPQMHPKMKKLLFLMINQIPKHIVHRRQCAQLWENLFAQNTILVSRLTFHKEETPYVGVFRSNHQEAAKIYNEYRNWPLSSWPDLPPEVRANAILHQTTIDFRDNMLVVPVHQTLNLKELMKRLGK